MKIHFPQFDTGRVLVVGDIMLDRYWHGPTSRISPEAPVPVVKIEQVEERPGGAGNVALNIVSLGGAASLVAITGDDQAAEILAQRLSVAKVDCHFVQKPKQPTITKLRVLSQHQQLIRLDFEEQFLAPNVGDFASVADKIAAADVVILSDYGKGALIDPSQLIALAQRNSKPVLVDPKGSDFSKYTGATLVKPNLSEFEAVVGHCKSESDIKEKGIALIKEFSWQALLVTRGDKGMTLIRENYPEQHFSAEAKEVFDVTGAGDTVIATVANALAAGCDLASAVALANTAAGIVVGKLGTVAVSLPELRRAFQLKDEFGSGIVTQEQLKLVVTDARAHNEKIIFTNGCFDILHPGHVSYLEQAKRQGDKLIVAVNDDASTMRLKGASRPINSIEHRMAVLAGLSAVDWVVPFSEDTPAQLISEISPDILVKGGDYRPEEIAGSQHVLDTGGEVKVLNFEAECSTSAVIKAIEERILQNEIA